MITLKNLPQIVKMSGSGNDFILVDNRAGAVPEDQMVSLTRSLCRRMVSVGADGMIFIESSEDYDFKWRFFNADGSEAEMCGNGGRCAARFAMLKEIAGPAMTFQTLAGPIQAWVDGAVVKLQLTRPRDQHLNGQLILEGKRQAFDFINTGVPHTIIWVEDNSQVEVNRLGRLIRFHDQFEPAGTNVNFVQPLPNGGLYVRTYERGVEGETLACGTGAVAAACVAFLKGKTVSPVRIKTSGGEILSVHLEGEPGEKIDKAYLEGMVRLVFQGEIFAEALAE